MNADLIFICAGIFWKTGIVIFVSDNNLLAHSEIKLTAAALTNAVGLWAAVTTNDALARVADMRRDKQRAVREFFSCTPKELPEINVLDVEAWRSRLTERGLKPSTVYVNLSHLSSFFEWLRGQPGLSEFLPVNPARAALPKKSKPYSSENTKGISDQNLRAIWQVIETAAAAGELIACRDRAIFRLFVATGARRAEILNLRGRDVEILAEGWLLLHTRVKGGDYRAKLLEDRELSELLLDYLAHTDRLNIFGTNEYLWLAHDRGAASRRAKTTASRKTRKKTEPAVAQLSRHAFARRMKLYARQAGVSGFHLHRLRHTFAQIVAEEAGSIAEAQDALGHRDLSTTRIYVRSIKVQRDRFSRRVRERLER